MASFSNTEIIGNVGNESEMRFLPNGKPTTTFPVAVNNRYTTASGERKEETEWFNVITFGKLAETCNQFINKSMMIFVSGRLSLHKWETPEGQRSKLELYANKVVFLSKAGESSTGSEDTEEESPY